MLSPKPITLVRGKRVTVAGLGRFGGGVGVARWLVREGARVLVTDLADAEALRESIQKLDGLDVNFRLGEHRIDDFRGADLVVASPAIPPTSPYLSAASDAGVPVRTEIGLFVERCPGVIHGVTATKGKSTTTTMLAKLLASRHPTLSGGNLGGSLLDMLPSITPAHRVVLELSSFMLHHLDAMQWSPRVAVVGMIGTDHLDWHGTLAAYHHAKQTILRHQSADDLAVINGDSAPAVDLAATGRARRALVRLAECHPFRLLVPGDHNQLNAQLAFAAASEEGIDRDTAQAVLDGFRGLPHRLEIVGEAAGVRFVNDSIATIPEAAVVACRAFPTGTVLQIVGGYDKHLPMDAMAAELAQRCKAVLCIGTTGPAIASRARSAPGCAAEVHDCGTLDRAVDVALRLASPGDVILLSPGCASYDQFENFARRGDAFRALASAIPTSETAP
jgi:UDP-N-acetylmuramoylalanine--D-glutamate ligase